MSRADDISSVRADASKLGDAMRKYARQMEILPEDIVRTQVGLLIRELADGAAPRNRAALEKSIEGDLGGVYAPMPRQKYLLPVRHQAGHGFRWLMVTKQVITGVKDQNYHPDDSVEDLKKLYHRTRQIGIIKGKKYVRIGTRGKQAVQELNRIVVRRGVYNDFKTWLKGRVGILGGSWAVAWDHLQPKGRAPQAYKFRHVKDGSANGTFIDGLGLKGKATFTLINRAAGVEQERQLQMVGSALRFRTKMLLQDLKNQLAGAYKKSFNR